MGKFTYFLEQPATRPIGDEPNEMVMRETTEPWECCWMIGDNFRQMAVPANYLFDGMSVPRFAWSLTGLIPGGMGDAASLPHDVLYRSKGGLLCDKLYGAKIKSYEDTTVSRKEADRVLKMMMVAAGFSKFKAQLAYMAVRLGGKRHWGGPSPALR